MLEEGISFFRDAKNDILSDSRERKMAEINNILDPAFSLRHSCVTAWQAEYD